MISAKEKFSKKWNKNRRPALFAQLISLPVLLLSLKAAENVWATNPNIVKIDTGFIRGSAVNDVVSFKGIPYAAPPVGKFRWRSPQAVVPWRHIRAATDFGADCMQKLDPSDAAPAGKTPAEDCLYANVWTPQNPPKPSLPVLVWIHGGAFVNGGTSTPLYDGTYFAKKGLVFVSINYRLGRFGFFAHPALTAAHEGPLGNYAIQDQIEALRWVQRNISYFGGDPKQVTIMGESAGGISILAHMTSTASQGLFHRAIVMSGGGRTWMTGGKELSGGAYSAEQTGIDFAKSVGIQGTGSATLTALRALPADKVVGDLNMTTLFLDPAQLKIYAGGPINDGEILVAPPEKMIKQKELAAVPVIVGSTDRDLSLENAKSKDLLFASFGANEAKARSLYDPDGQKDLRELNQEVGADKLMNEPARFLAKQTRGLGNAVWIYRFNYVAEFLRDQWQGASHASELPYLFKTLSVRYGPNVSSKDQEMSDAIGVYFTNFAKTGNPNGISQPPWAVFDPSVSSILLFTLDQGPIMMTPDLLQQRLDLVEKLAENPVRIMRNQVLN